MTQPTPETFATGDVKREPQGRAVAVRLKGGQVGWMVVSTDAGMRIASAWEADMIQQWPDVPLDAPNTPNAKESPKRA